MPLQRNQRRIGTSLAETRGADPGPDPRWSSPDASEELPEESPESPVEVAAEPVAETAPFVRIKHPMVGHYLKDSVVPVVAFENLERLLGLGAVEYDRFATEATIVDETVAMATRLSAPPPQSQMIPRAPWVNASVGDLLGPATPRLVPPRFDVGAPSHQTITVP